MSTLSVLALWKERVAHGKTGPVGFVQDKTESLSLIFSLPPIYRFHVITVLRCSIYAYVLCLKDKPHNYGGICK